MPKVNHLTMLSLEPPFKIVVGFCEVMPPLQALWVFFGEIAYGDNNPMSLS